jgi:GWxTD domain-containing protein
MELYYSFPDNQLKYEALENYFSSQVLFNLNYSQNNKQLDSVFWEQEIISDKPVTNFNTNLIGLKVILVPQGSLFFDFTVYSTSKNKQNIIPIYTKSISVNSPNYDKQSVEVSSLQIASILEPESKKSFDWSQSFLKNSLYVVPNPGVDLVGDSLVLNCYFEIYNAKKSSPDGLDIVYTVLDAGKTEVFHYPRKKKSYADAMVEFISLPVDALPTGVYYLQVDVISSNSEKFKSELKKFYVTNFEIPPTPLTEFYESEQFELSEFSTLSDEGVDNHFAQIRPLASDYETGIWDNCTTLGAKRRFLFSFWVNRNPDTTKPYNLALEEFREKISYSNKYFKYGLNEEGWRTPRGRITIKYGHPNLVDRHESNGTIPAYEIWKYDILEGGSEFVFIDMKNNGYFHLVHSTIAGEIRNENWYEQYIEKQDPDQDFKYRKNNFR